MARDEQYYRWKFEMADAAIEAGVISIEEFRQMVRQSAAAEHLASGDTSDLTEAQARFVRFCYARQSTLETIVK